ncbi:hypothetical protein [Micromonospora chersina]|uniref:Uncharacterized protein n=1 Tax=Micromonospora chersina TaxID=47854 RepID=A0A1C6UAR8_9ACTN|nr:hypothetical protein [Micromonospora chersina]SCL51011.1 hypothetical protein GA0070603_1111 [Micromonospora chersina]
MSSPLEAFAGLLDRSVQEIATLAADARSFDASRIGRVADIWDNNTVPLVAAASAPWPLRSRRASAGLRWMADLGADRRRLIVDLDPSLDRVLPAARPERSVHRDYQGRVFPGAFPLTAEIIAALAQDYDLDNGTVRAFTVGPADSGLQVQLTLAAPRRFTPSTGRVARDGSIKPWPAAPLRFTFDGVTDLRFDAEDRLGMVVSRDSVGSAVAIGRSGRLRAIEASVWPDDPRWYESTAGQAADLTTPHGRPQRRKSVRTSALTTPQRAAARALVMLMSHARLVHHYPNQAAGVPILDICRVAAGAGSAILAASARHGAARQKAYAELEQRWRHVPPTAPPDAVRSGPVLLRHARYDEPHDDHDVPRRGCAVLLAAVPDADPASPWALASEEITQPSRFRIASTAFDGVQHVSHDAGTLSIGDKLVVG